MRWIKEIKAVGFKNWCWFVFVCRRDEFNTPTKMFGYKGGSISLEEHITLIILSLI